MNDEVHTDSLSPFLARSQECYLMMVLNVLRYNKFWHTFNLFYILQGKTYYKKFTYNFYLFGMESSESLEDLFQEQTELLELLCSETAFKKKYSFTLKQYFQERKTVSQKTLNIADRLQEMIKNTGIAKSVGGGAGILSGILTIGGIALAPFSGGLSLGLTAVGVGTGIGSAATSLISEGIRNSNLKDFVQELQSECCQMNQMDVQFIDLKKALIKNIEEMNSYIKNHSKSKKKLFTFFIEKVQQNQILSTLVAQNYVELLAQNYPEIGSHGTVNYKKLQKVLTEIEFGTTGKVVATGAYTSLAVGNRIAGSGVAVVQSVEALRKLSTASMSTAASLTESGIIGTSIGKNVGIAGKSAFATASKILGPALAVVGIGFGIYEVVQGAQDIQSSQIADDLRKSVKQFDQLTQEHENFIKGIQQNFQNAKNMGVNQGKDKKRTPQNRESELIPFSVTDLRRMPPQPCTLWIPSTLELKQKSDLMKLIEELIEAGLADLPFGYILHAGMSKEQMKELLKQMKKQAKNHATRINLISRRSLQLNKVFIRLLEMLFKLEEDFEFLKEMIIEELQRRGFSIEENSELETKKLTILPPAVNLDFQEIISLIQICRSHSDGDEQNKTPKVFTLTQEDVIKLQKKFQKMKNIKHKDRKKQNINEDDIEEFGKDCKIKKENVTGHHINPGNSIVEAIQNISSEDLLTVLNQYIHQNYEELRSRVEGRGIESILQFFSGRIYWNPANIVIGPAGKLRTGDPGEKVDEEILATKSENFQKWFKKMRKAFTKNNLKKYFSLFLRLPRENGTIWIKDPKDPKRYIPKKKDP